jgi:hypothetical protein
VSVEVSVSVEGHGHLSDAEANGKTRKGGREGEGHLNPMHNNQLHVCH